MVYLRIIQYCSLKHTIILTSTSKIIELFNILEAARLVCDFNLVLKLLNTHLTRALLHIHIESYCLKF